MEKFKKQLKIRICWLSALSITTALLGVYDVFFASEELKALAVFKFQTGLTTAICILSSITIMKYNNVFHSDYKLKLEYNKINDERFQAIKRKAGIPTVTILSVIMLIAGIVIGYFNITIFYTLIITALSQILVSAIIKLVYMRRM